MKAQGSSNLSKYDRDLFFQIIGNAAYYTNCIPSMYAASLAYYLKKKRMIKAFSLLNYMNIKDLAAKLPETVQPSKTWIYHLIINSPFKISSPQQLEFDRRHSCNVAIIYFYHMLHKPLFERPPSHVLNMDETMLTAKRRLKVLARSCRLPLIPEALKVPYFTDCVTFTASGYLFDPLIILPNKKNS